MKTLNKTLAAVAAGTMLTTAFRQSAKEVRGASPCVEIKNEPAPKLIVDPPLPEGLALGVFWAQYRVENLHIAFLPHSPNLLNNLRFTAIHPLPVTVAVFVAVATSRISVG